MSQAAAPEWSLRRRQPGQSAIEHVQSLHASKAPYTEIRPWELGAHGERIAGRIFDGLGPEWTVLHDVPVGGLGANIDHVLIGPSGVFTVNTKHHPKANVIVDGSDVLVRGQRWDYAEKAVYEGKRASSLLTACSGRFVPVQPLLLFVKAESVDVQRQPLGVLVTSDHEVLDLLASLTPDLSPKRVRELVAVAEHPENWAYESWAPVDDHAVPRTSAVDQVSDILAARRKTQPISVKGLLGALRAVAIAVGSVVLFMVVLAVTLMLLAAAGVPIQ